MADDIIEEGQVANESVKPEKKRGRPKKSTSIPNEEREMITMSHDDEEVNLAERQYEMKNGVGKVKSVPEQVTLDQIQSRWKSIFSRYANLGIESIMGSWGERVASTSNPFIQNQRIKQINSRPAKLDKKELAACLSDPESNEQSLRSVSLSLYYTNYIYYSILQMYRNTPKYHYYASPLYIGADKKKSKEKLKEDSIKVDRLLKKFNPKLTFKTIATQVAIEGKCSYLVRTSYSKDDVDFLVLQKLNSDNCKIVRFGSKQQFVTSFNMSIFLQAGYSVDDYPQFIRDVWENMQKNNVVVLDKKGRKKINPKADLPNGHVVEVDENGNFMYWVALPQSVCYTFYSDGAHPNAFPDTLGLFEDFNDLSDYRWLQGNLLSRGVTSLLTAEVPIQKDAKAGSDATVISPDVILGYQDFFNQTVSEQYAAFFAPFNDFKLHGLESNPEALDIIYDRIRDLIATSGLSGLLPITDKPSIASVKAQEALLASKCDYLTKQFEQFLYNVINENFDLNYTWQVNIWGDVFYERDDRSAIKEMVLNGATGLTGQLLSAYDMTLEDFDGGAAYTDLFDIVITPAAGNYLYGDLLTQRTTAKESDSRDARSKEGIIETSKTGRPSLSDSAVENDNTATSKDAGNNVSDIKGDYSVHVCHRCGAELGDGEEILCDECIEQLYDDRGLYS